MPQDNSDMPIEVVRLAKRPQFLFVRGGQAERRKCLVVQARQRTGDAPGSHIGAGFTATKKVGGAVTRNRSRRRLRAAVGQVIPQSARNDCDYVVIVRAGTARRSYDKLISDLEVALKKCDALAHTPENAS